MRNKNHVQTTLGRIEAIQQSFIQFIRNTPLTEEERMYLERQIELSKQEFDQMRTWLNQEEEVYNQSPANYGVKSGRF